MVLVEFVDLRTCEYLLMLNGCALNRYDDMLIYLHVDRCKLEL